MRALLALVLVAALAVGVWLALPHRGRVVGVESPTGEVARSLVVMPGAEGAAKTIIRVYEPEDGSSVKLDELDDVTFRWSSVEGARAYMFMANNEFGNLIWRTQTRDTTLTLPEKVLSTLARGERLKWIVQVPVLSASTDLYRLGLE